MKNRIGSIITTLILVIGVVMVMIDIVPRLQKKSEKTLESTVFTVSAVVYRQTVGTIIENADLIVEVEILDTLTKKNSVFTPGYSFPGEVADFYSLRKVKVLDVLSMSLDVKKGDVISVIEPIAIREDGTIFELDCYRYKTILKKGQKVTLFLELMDNGYYSIMVGGNAQINSELENGYGYSEILDIVINGKNVDNEVIELIKTAVPVGYVMCFNDMEIVLIETKSQEYLLYYRYIPEQNETYLEVGGLSYIIWHNNKIDN